MPDHQRTGQGTYRITFESPYFFGDRVAFDSVNGQGEGHILDIVLSADGSVYYTVNLDDGTAQGGIYAHEIQRDERPAPPVDQEVSP